MTNTDPSGRFSMDAVRKFESGEQKPSESPKLNKLAQQVAAQYRTDSMSPVMVGGVLRVIEFFVLFASGIAIFVPRTGFATHLFWEHFFVVAATALVASVGIELADGYQIRALVRPVRSLGRIAIAWVAAFGLLAAIYFMFNLSRDFALDVFAEWFAVGFVVVVAVRFATARLVRRWARNGRIERRAVIVGGGKPAEELIRSIEQEPFSHIRICGIFDDRDDKRSPPIVAGYPKLGNISELIEFARITHIDMLIVTIPITAEQRVLSMLKKLWVLPVDIRLSAHNSQFQFRPRSYSYVGSVPMLDVFDKPITDWDSVAKRAFDIVFSIIGIVLLSPVMLVTAIAVKLDSRGPVFFKQKRHGFNNEVIEVLKFRSMYTDKSDPTARNAVTKNDPRVTRVGRFIRKTSIDELPQFFNSLFGSLSLVGPRPHAVAAQSHNMLYTEVVDGYFARHRVKPGVTGWAQINGWRGELDTDEKIRMRTELDLYYIENWSLWFDLKILLLTPIRLLNTENAY